MPFPDGNERLPMPETNLEAIPQTTADVVGSEMTGPSPMLLLPVVL